MVFDSFVSFKIVTYDSSGIKNKEGGLYFRLRHFRWYFSPKKQKQRKQLWW